MAERIRVRILQSAFNASKGHIGSALSIADIVAVVAPRVRGLGTRDPGRDRFVLSKGHAAMAWYGALCELHVIDDELHATYGQDDSLLGTHPDPELPGVDFMTGSLGQGLSYAVGSAMAANLSGNPWSIYVVLSDSELDEGVTWEAALIAAHHRCSTLTVVLDLNGQQALGYTRDVLDTSAAPAAFAAMGWHVSEVDGHDVDALNAAVSLDAEVLAGRPHLIVAKTSAGKGVRFMERRIEWHYLPMTEAQYTSALAELGETPSA
ncbi:transketolase [Rhizocola hellebori]|uniref:transketolase n=1 Tax=Rhizocola hellebori TaxID=1392758 RepID=UPI0023B20F42|nr:1-deoxy-D-xylulose-5-phosphate synthase N-terminal domain-containing protein [Rhizocola hellebori]